MGIVSLAFLVPQMHQNGYLSWQTRKVKRSRQKEKKEKKSLRISTGKFWTSPLMNSNKAPFSLQARVVSEVSFCWNFLHAPAEVRLPPPLVSLEPHVGSSNTVCLPLLARMVWMDA